ncbi:MAG: tRNA-dihydrouridine synthase family protein [Acidobacteriota bacterium]
MEKLKIGDLELQHRTVLAPMASLTDIVFRRVVDEIGGVGLMVTELISAEGLRRKQDKTLAMIRTFNFKTPQFIQLFGSEPEAFTDSVKYIEDETDYSGIDLNMGCPAGKVTKKGAGAALLKEPEKIGKICREIRKVISLPFTVKIRLGYEKENVFELLKILEGEGVDAVTIHFRLKTDSYSSEARWEYAEKIKERSNLKIIGNGNILNRNEALEKLNITDGIMIGRAAIKNPFLFSEIAGALPGMEGKSEVAGRIMDLTREYYPEHLRLPRIKGFTKYLTSGKPHSKKIKHEIFRSQSFEEVRSLFKIIFN